MAENYKHLYEQTKKMLTQYQDELIPGFRKQIEELEETVVHQRKRADTAETFICTMCAECEWEVHDGILIMQKACCSEFPECEKFKLRVADNNVGGKWIPVTERLPEDDLPKGSKVKQIKVLTVLKADSGARTVRSQMRYRCTWYTDSAPWTWKYSGSEITHWMPLPEPPKEVE